VDVETVDVEAQKRAAARRATEYVRDGMVVGLGSGSTAELFVAELGARVGNGLRVRGVPTSERTAALAAAAGLALTSLDEVPRLDLTVDGADEVEPSSLALVKGRGGALVREKLVAAATDRVVIVADQSKIVPTLGLGHPVPIAVVPFGWRQTADRLRPLGGQAELRRRPDGSPFRTDDGHAILDCRFGPIAEPARLAGDIKTIVGVVEHGLFVDLADWVVVGGPDGATVLERSAPLGSHERA
jgi:ribose 5-phosphate isomerase A